MAIKVIKEKCFTRLKREIAYRGFTCEQVAGRMGLSKQSLTNKIHGRSAWTLQDVYTIGNTLGIKGAELLELFPEELIS